MGQSELCCQSTFTRLACSCSVLVKAPERNARGHVSVDQGVEDGGESPEGVLGERVIHGHREGDARKLAFLSGGGAREHWIPR